MDEAHKLPEAARQMFGTSLEASDIQSLIRSLRQEKYLLASESLADMAGPLLKKMALPFIQDRPFDQFARLLTGPERPMILTSGTLAVGTDFRRFKEETGLLADGRVVESVSASPFDYQKNCLLYLPEFPPRPKGTGLGRPDGNMSGPPRQKDRGYYDLLAEEVTVLLEAAWGHALVLFTSYAAMSAVKERLTRKGLDWLESRPFTTAFVTGNHENYDALQTYPLEQWRGGAIRRIRPSVILLERGQVFKLCRKRFFTMGGARSHDIQDGILEPDDPLFRLKQRTLDARDAMYRVNHLSWWKEELPSEEEYQTARASLDRAGWEVDYIITHCCPSSVQDVFSGGLFQRDQLTDFLEEVRQRCRF